MYLNGMGFRAIARVTDIDHAIIINWVKEKGKRLSDEPQGEELPEITEIDELQTFVGCKKNKFWVGSVVNHWNQGILLWTVGDRSHETFEQIWQIIKCWHSFWYVTRTHSRPSRLTTRGGTPLPLFEGRKLRFRCAYALRWKVYPMYIQQSRSSCWQNIYDA